MLATPDANVLNACRTLFGTEAALSPEPLLSLKPNVLKTAFRKKAKEIHPDLFTAHDALVQKRLAEMFSVANDVYDIVRRYCELRDNAGVRITRSRASGRPDPRARPQRTPGDARSQQRRLFA